MKLFYSVSNLRALTETPEIELRPITILVGKNSAGKSTFLRSLALLRQSLEARSSAPVLWYGEYVDFGDFSSAVHNRETEKEITFSFSAEGLSVRSRELNYPFFYDDYSHPHQTRRSRSYSKITFKVTLGEQLKRTVRRGLTLSVPEHEITAIIKFAKDGRSADSFLVNGCELSEILPGHSVAFNSSDIFANGTLFTTLRQDNRTFRRAVNPISAFSEYIARMLKDKVDKRILDENIEAEARRILRHPMLSQRALGELKVRADTISFGRFYESLSSGRNPELLGKINIVCAMYSALQSLADCGDYFREFFVATTYLGPARARSERYYRFQELEVSEIAPDGHNLPMFLGSIHVTQLTDFSEWVEGLFGFGVGIQRNEGHISIQLTRNNLAVNVADTGYGVSQLLPVLAQIWWASKANQRYRESRSAQVGFYPITMEQPELHLHPAHQAQLADALLNALSGHEKQSDKSPVFIVETHSEALINRLGELVESKLVDPSDIQIVIFSNDDEQVNSTIISTSTFDEQGALRNWPYGFFSY